MTVYVLKATQKLDSSRCSLSFEDQHVEGFLNLSYSLFDKGTLRDEDMLLLGNWLKTHSDLIDLWPISILAKRVKAALMDGKIDPEEKKEIFDLISKLLGVRNTTELGRTATRLPIDENCHDLIFKDKTFCLTGQFIYGGRKICEHEVIQRGGNLDRQPTHATDYLVIGTMATIEWAHACYGRKIERAVELKANHCPIQIVGEETWVACLSQNPILDVQDDQISQKKQAKRAKTPSSRPPVTGQGAIFGKKFVITGTLSKPRPDFQKRILALGGEVSGSVSSKTDYLLAGEEAGSKLDKARELGVTILNEAEFENLASGA